MSLRVWCPHNDCGPSVDPRDCLHVECPYAACVWHTEESRAFHHVEQQLLDDPEPMKNDGRIDVNWDGVLFYLLFLLSWAIVIAVAVGFYRWTK